jgi:hypothetical protein
MMMMQQKENHIEAVLKTGNSLLSWHGFAYFLQLLIIPRLQILIQLPLQVI